MKHVCTEDSPQALKTTLAILGDRYTALIIRLMHESPKRFKDFEENIDGISPRTLSQRLLMLEEKGVLEKNTCPDSPGRCQYELTEAGIALGDVIHSMAQWGKMQEPV